ncbi:MAG: hypothetical protein HYZ75_09450 [Elusimicrobia bacterium]|nr:hypothetical protein [Elusimicrobiota bacterium]
MSWAVGAALASTALNAVIGSLAWARGRRRPVYRSLALMSLSFALWSGAYCLAAPDFDDPLWVRLLFTPLAWLPGASLSFAWSFTGLDPAARRRRTVPLYLAGTLALGLMWAGRISLQQYRAAFIVGGLPVFAAAIGLLTLHWWRAAEAAERNRRGYLAVAAWLAVIGGFTDFLPNIGVPFLGMANVALMAWSLLVLAAIERHHLLDLGDAARQAGALLAGSAVLGLVVTLLEWSTRRLGGNLFVTLFLTSALAVAVLPPLWDRFVGSAGKLLSARQARLDRALTELERKLEAGGDLAAAEALARAVVETLWGARAAVHWEPRELGGLKAPSLPDELAAVLGDREDSFTAAALRREGDSALTGRLEARGFEAGVPIKRDGARAGWLFVSAPSEGYYDLAALRALSRMAAALGRALRQAETTRAMLHADRLAQMGTMAAGIAHEIRNPLSAMLGAVEVLGLPITEEQKADSLRILKEEVLRLDSILTGLLEYASPRARNERCRWREVFDRTIRLMRPDLPDEVEVSVAGDELELAVSSTHLQQILINLVKNAAREAARAPASGGRPAVSVSLARSGGKALLCVADTGSGIPDELLPRLFTPFASESPDGTGLGLATVRRLAELYGGGAWAENAPRGARFLVELPPAA